MLVADSATRQPVPYARASLPGRPPGLSSSEGRLALIAAQPGDTIYVSHLSYEPRAARWSPGDTLFLLEKPRVLDEVAIYAETGASLFLKAAARLPENHDCDSLVYQVQHRLLDYETGREQLHVLAEYIFRVSYENNRNAYIHVQKARIKAFSAAGSASVRDMFGIPVFISAFHTPRMSHISWKKSTLKTYDISIEGTTLHEGRRLIALQMEPRKPGPNDPRFLIYLDEASLALARIEERPSEEGRDGERIIAFRPLEGKWLLDYVISRYTGSDYYQRWQAGSSAAREALYLYQPLLGQVKDEAFVHFMGMMSIPQPDYLEAWDRAGWEEMDRIPLPSWAEALIED